MKGYFEMYNEILNYRVDKVVITYEAWLSRIGSELFKYMFQRSGTGIAVVSEFKAQKAYKKHPELFTGRPGIPEYVEKNGEYILIFTNQQK